MRAGLLCVGVLALLPGCDKPRSQTPAPTVAMPKAAPAPAVQAWDPGDLQAMAVRDAACGSAGFSAIVKEAEAIRLTGGAERRGGVLTLGNMRFENKGVDEDGLDSEDFTYLGAYRDSGVHAVLAAYHEVFDVTLVDRRNGKSTTMPSLPIVSPNGRFFAAAIGTDYSGHQLKIVERTVEGWVKRADFGEAVAHSPCALRWLDADTLVLRSRWSTGLPDPFVDWSPELDEAWGPARVIRTGSSWRYEAPRR